MLHQRQCLAFGLEACQHLLAVHPRLDQLDGDEALDRLGLLSHPDGAHAAFADLLQEFVPAADDGARGGVVGPGGLPRPWLEPGRARRPGRTALVRPLVLIFANWEGKTPELEAYSYAGMTVEAQCERLESPAGREFRPRARLLPEQEHRIAEPIHREIRDNLHTWCDW